MRALLLLLFLSIPACALPPGLCAVHPVSRGLVGWWTFRQMTGSTTGMDTSGYGRQLAPSNLGGGQPPFFYAWYTNNGQTWNCANFQRSIYAASSFSGLPTGAAPYTHAFWVQAQQNAGYPAILCVYTGASPAQGSDYNGVGIGNGVTAHIQVTTWPYASTGYQVGLPTGVWYHLAYVFDGTYVRAYINGWYYNTVASSQTTPSPVTQFFFGSIFGGFAYWGMLSDYRIYNRALTDAEVFQIATQYQ